jgi:hypothetical protein
VARNLEEIVGTVAAPRVVLSSIPPRDDDPQVAVTFNAGLQRLAAQHQWTFVDPMAAVRDGDTFRDGLTGDGVHPTPEGARLIGQAMRQALVG